jgi:hypothetical protein
MNSDTAKGFLLAVAVALLAALGVFLWLVGAETLRTVALVISGALALALTLGASALPIRAYRRKDLTGETHHYHDGTKTIVKEVRVIDGRQSVAPEVKLLQLPAQAPGGAFPELLRAAYAAGTMRLPDRRQEEPAIDAELRELDLDPDRDGWEGDITP